MDSTIAIRVKSTWEKQTSSGSPFRSHLGLSPAFNNAFRGATPLTKPSGRNRNTAVQSWPRTRCQVLQGPRVESEAGSRSTVRLLASISPAGEKLFEPWLNPHLPLSNSVDCNSSEINAGKTSKNKQGSPFEVLILGSPRIQQCFPRGNPGYRTVRKEPEHRGTILAKDSSSSSPGTCRIESPPTLTYGPTKQPYSGPSRINFSILLTIILGSSPLYHAVDLSSRDLISRRLSITWNEPEQPGESPISLRA